MSVMQDTTGPGNAEAAPAKGRADVAEEGEENTTLLDPRSQGMWAESASRRAIDERVGNVEFAACLRSSSK